MTRILEPAGAAVSGSLAEVLDRAVAEGASEPPWIAVQDDRGEWIRAVAGMPAEVRAQVVIAASDEAGLVTAARLGVGGAMWLPPSLAGAVAAMEAASRPPAVRSRPDAWLADLVGSFDEDLVAVTWARRAFWRCQLGEPLMATALARLADILSVLPALLPWPALLMRPLKPARVLEAWSDVTDRFEIPSEGLEIVPCDRREGHCGVVTAAMRSLAAAGGSAVDPGHWGFPKPVHELPRGRRVGWWSAAEMGTELASREWLAFPDELSEVGFRWRLRDGGGGDAGWAEDSIGVSGAPVRAVRIPGWMTGELSPGRPAGLLVERLASAADRMAVPLWVPNVRPESLQMLLRLPGAIWVDGPVVPSES